MARNTRDVRVSRTVVASRPLADAPIALGPSGAFFSLFLAVEGVLCGVAGALNQASVVNSAAAAVLLTGHRQAIEG